VHRDELTRWFLRAVVAFLVLTALLAIVIFVRGEFGETEGRILATTFALAVYSLSALAGAVLVGRGPLGAFGWATIAVSAVALILALVTIWGDPDAESESLLKTTLVALVLAFASAWVSLLLARRRADDAGSVTATLAGTVAAVSVLGLLVVAAIVREEEPSDLYWRLLGVVAVLAVLGTLLLPVLRRMARPVREGQARTE
jgi:hypothetical protein